MNPCKMRQDPKSTVLLATPCSKTMQMHVCHPKRGRSMFCVQIQRLDLGRCYELKGSSERTETYYMIGENQRL